MIEKAAQLVFIPFPAIGHLLSALEFAKFLTNHDRRLCVTVLDINWPFDTTTTTTAYTNSLSSSDEERIRVINLPRPQPEPEPNDIDTTNNSEEKSETKPHLATQASTLVQSQKPNVKQAVSDLIRSNSAPDSPQLAAFVVDMFCTSMIDVANEFGVPALVYFTSGAAFLGLVLHLRLLWERDGVDSTEFKDSDTELSVPSFANPVPSGALPSVSIEKEWHPFFLDYAKRLNEADGIIVNTFEELESHAIRSLTDGGPPVYPVGPILNLKGETRHGSESDSDAIVEWLDDQPPSSVIFLCFGSLGSFDEDQVREIARALENSGARFLWSLRKSPPKGTMGMPSYYPDLVAGLPEGFLNRTAGIGKIVGWAPQARVLAHKAIGGFVSHCGWNSILESIYFGVPIAAWPLYAEQRTNAFQLVRELEVAVEISMGYGVDIRGGNKGGVLSADKIERGIRNVLEGESEIRKNVKEMSEKTRKTLKEGGCSYSYLGRLIDYIMDRV